MLSKPVMVHVSCVQTVVNALKLSCAVRATRNVPPELRTIAAPPTDARGDDESICTTTALPLTLPFSEDNYGTLLGLDPPPPPHAAASEPSARHDAAWQAWMQKVLRSISVSCDMSSTSRGWHAASSKTCAR